MSLVAIAAPAEGHCEGCQQGLELKGTVHYDAEGYPVMTCAMDVAPVDVNAFLHDEENPRFF